MFGSGLEIKSRYLGSQFMGKGLFALREILFVLQKNLSTRNHFQCERFFSSTKIFSSVTKLQRHRRVALEAYNFFVKRKNLLFRDSYPSTGHHIS